jgi:hypothetical protein
MRHCMPSQPDNHGDIYPALATTLLLLNFIDCFYVALSSRAFIAQHMLLLPTFVSVYCGITLCVSSVVTHLTGFY